MDHIYPTKDYTEYKIDEHVCELQRSLSISNMPESFDEISQTLNITEDEFRKKTIEICKVLEDYGDEKSSNVEEEPFSAFPEASLELNCMKFLKKGGTNFKEDRCKESRLNVKSSPVINDNASNIEPYSDAILTVRFYEPFKYTPCMKNQPRFHQEFKVLASNYLSELRDKFYCQCNYGPFTDISENPMEDPVIEENSPNPGFFFIHDTFYNDTRKQQSGCNHDYSNVILKFFKRFNYMREFKTAIMQDTQFKDLKIRIGYPSCYQHFGACEHVFCITSVDLIDSSDSLLKSDYPKLIYTSKKRPTLCEICNQRNAEFLVTNCPLHVKDPTKLCENCFYSFHYLNKEVKTCEFNAYRLYSTNPEISEESEQNEQHADDETTM